MDAKFACGLFHLALAVILVLILPEPASPAPLALRVQVPIDVWRPVVLLPRPTEPAKPLEQADVSVLKPRGGDGEEEGHGGEARLKFRGMNLPREFSAYDLNKNRGVSLFELAAVTDTELKDAREPFEAADVDGDQVLSPEEFTQAPWIFDAGGITLIDSAQEPELGGAEDAGAHR